MKRNINASLETSVQGVGKRTTPDDLKKRGVRNIRSVSMEQLSKLIERVVSEILRERGYPFSAQEIATLKEQSAQRVHDALEIQRNLKARKADLEQTQKQFQHELAAAEAQTATSSDGSDDVLERRIRKVMSFVEETKAAIDHALEHVENRKRPSYQAPRGLNASDPNHDQRTKLMQGVFRSNQDVRQDAEPQ